MYKQIENVTLFILCIRLACVCICYYNPECLYKIYFPNDLNHFGGLASFVEIDVEVLNEFETRSRCSFIAVDSEMPAIPIVDFADSFKPLE